MKKPWWGLHFSQREVPLLFTTTSQHEYLTKLICNSILVVASLFWLVTLLSWFFHLIDNKGLLITTLILVLSYLLSFFTARGFWYITRFFPIVLFFIHGIYGSLIGGGQTSYELFYVISFIITGLLIGNRSMFGCIVAALVLHICLFQVISQPTIEKLLVSILITTSSFSVIGLVLWISINLQQRALEKSKKDSLTGVNNRSFFDAEIERLNFGRQFPITIVYADINNLKQTNDHQGHAAGDRLLQLGADLLQTITRSDDILCRLGGDEFAILCIKTDETVAGQIEKRIHHKIDQHNMSSNQAPISIAIGTASTSTPGTLLETVRLADDRMYLNKTEQKSRQSQAIFTEQNN